MNEDIDDRDDYSMSFEDITKETGLLNQEILFMIQFESYLLESEQEIEDYEDLLR